MQPNGTIWVVWHTYYKDDSDQINDIRLARSTDSGATFQVETLLDGFDESKDRHRPLITVDESTGRVYILTHEYRILDEDEGYYIDLVAFDAAGNKDIAETTINDVPRAGRGSFPSLFSQVLRMDIAARDGVVCAAWEDKRERFAIFGSCSIDGGQTFGPNVNISGPDGEFPRLAIAPDGALYVSYKDANDSDNNILLRRSTDQGQTWSDPISVTGQYELGDEVREWDMAVDANGQIAIAWIEDLFTGSNLYLSTSVDRGRKLCARCHRRRARGSSNDCQSI